MKHKNNSWNKWGKLSYYVSRLIIGVIIFSLICAIGAATPHIPWFKTAIILTVILIGTFVVWCVGNKSKKNPETECVEQVKPTVEPIQQPIRQAYDQEKERKRPYDQDA